MVAQLLPTVALACRAVGLAVEAEHSLIGAIGEALGEVLNREILETLVDRSTDKNAYPSQKRISAALSRDADSK